MRIEIVTLFPELFEAFGRISFVGRAQQQGALALHCENLREHGRGRHKNVDDTPYGGGSGMVLRVDVVAACLESLDERAGSRAHRVLMTPQGVPFQQRASERLAHCERMVLICGRYEGFDERVRSLVDEEISLGDFVMTGGEVSAMAVVEAVVRHLPGVLGNQDSTREESHGEEGLLEYPQYTRPAEFRGQGVPEMLQSGHHAAIAAWRRDQSLERTKQRRPDLIAKREAK